MTTNSQIHNLLTKKTIIYVDASNIANACVRSCGWELDFEKLYLYFQRKYPGSQVKFFQGVEKGNALQKQNHEKLGQVGYEIYALERKIYKQSPLYKKIQCNSCGVSDTYQIFPEAKNINSNIDVWLATECMYDVALHQDEGHIIIVSCDGDFAEMIRKILENYSKIRISVLVTPTSKKINYVSSRLKELMIYPQYKIINIENIRDHVRK